MGYGSINYKIICNFDSNKLEKNEGKSTINETENAFKDS